ncbi:hypothetical protein J1614_007562 [Plenodomus biglobosus]|nr:hypothetical protein J1614_007562 [Plenodomus biglobosus]
MAEVVGVIAFALTIAGVAASAIQLSQALFSVAQALKNAPHKIAEIAEEIHCLSSSLLILDEFLTVHQSLYKPALFENIKFTLARYVQVDKELRKLTDHSKKLARLAFCFKRQKAKSLQKKVESIKSALTLQLNIVQLTQEEIRRPESIEKLDFWGEEHPDTAPWLYQLVFYPPVLPYPTQSDELPHQASVSEEKDELAIDLSDARYDSDTAEPKPSNGDMTMIVWERQTEPNLVVDRLLSDWTVLSAEQILQTSSPHDGDDWLESFDRMLVEAKRLEDKQDEEARELTDDAKSRCAPNNGAQREDIQSRSRSNSIDPSTARASDSASGNPFASINPSYHQFTSNHDDLTERATDSHSPSSPPSHRYESPLPQPCRNSPNTLYPPAPMPNEFSAPTSSNSSASRSSSNIGPHPQVENFGTQSADAIISAIEILLTKSAFENRPEPEDSRFVSIIQQLITKQTSQAETCQAQTKAAMEVDLKHIQIARDKDHEKITKLEDLIKGQREEQRVLETTCKAERLAFEEIAAKQIRLAKEVAEKEIAAAHVVKKTAKKTMEFAKAQAEKKAQEQRQIQVIRHQKRIEEDQIRRLNRIEDLVQARHDSTNQHQAPIGPHPVRRTCIRDGDRSIKVAEFTTEKLEPLANIPFIPFDYCLDEASNQDDASNSRQTQSHVRLYLSSANSINSVDTSSRRSSAQLIHAYIFQPDHKPQLKALPDASSTHSVVINTAFVEHAAMEELGHRNECNNHGVYILDGCLTHVSTQSADIQERVLQRLE